MRPVAKPKELTIESARRILDVLGSRRISNVEKVNICCQIFVGWNRSAILNYGPERLSQLFISIEKGLNTRAMQGLNTPYLTTKNYLYELDFNLLNRGIDSDLLKRIETNWMENFAELLFPMIKRKRSNGYNMIWESVAEREREMIVKDLQLARFKDIAQTLKHISGMGVFKFNDNLGVVLSESL